MSDDEEITYVRKQKTIHYGSLEDQERIRLSSLTATDSDGEPKAIGGNINVSNGNNIILSPVAVQTPQRCRVGHDYRRMDSPQAGGGQNHCSGRQAQDRRQRARSDRTSAEHQPFDGKVNKKK
ncbi:uncharacterized protein LOC126552089 [Aphis gossypii]|uniref:uncharacterized protein LOC126552089 n=1 Tax=Aphis gossypii TaxID=80765 RepID=UPI002158C3D9|nr:uncharacterized protein LOC126552089 [Aphis gossypii]